MAEGPYPFEDIEGAKISSDSPLPSVQWDLERHNGHPCSDPNQSHIGKSPSANPIDQATHYSFASNTPVRRPYPSSRSRIAHVLGTSHLDCVRVHRYQYWL